MDIHASTAVEANKRTAPTSTPVASDTARLIWILPIHALVWTIAAWLSRGNLDVQGDMVETYVWGIEWQAGYIKHPPLSSWIAAAWFDVFPRNDLAYFALAAVNALLGLWAIVLIAKRFMPQRFAVLAGFAMAVSPLYSNLAIKFNPNAVLLSVWPWTAYCFVRLMQADRRSTRCWAAIALGVLAALSVLGKYFSVVLLMGLFFAALARPAWRARLVSGSALLVVAAGAATLAPHVHWLVVNHFPTLGYAAGRTGGTMPAAVARFGVYTLAQIGYLALSFVFVLLLVNAPRARAAKLMAQSAVKPALNPDLWWLSLGPLFAVGVISIASKTQMASVWGMAQWFAIAPLWLAVLSRADIDIDPSRAARLLTGYWAIVLAISAAVGYAGALRNTDDAAEPRAELAAAVHAMWRERTGQDLAIAAGSSHEAGSVAYYGTGEKTRYWSVTNPRSTPWFTLDEVTRQGAVFVCLADDAPCVTASANVSHAQPIALDISRHAWGRTLPARHYAVFVMLPGESGHGH